MTDLVYEEKHKIDDEEAAKAAAPKTPAQLLMSSYLLTTSQNVAYRSSSHRVVPLRKRRQKRTSVVLFNLTSLRYFREAVSRALAADGGDGDGAKALRSRILLAPP